MCSGSIIDIKRDSIESVVREAISNEFDNFVSVFGKMLHDNLRKILNENNSKKEE